jgi:hypothetical protein
VGQDLFAGTWLDGLYRSQDNGTTWTSIATSMSQGTITSLAAVGTTLYAGTNFGGVYHSQSNGLSWSRLNPSSAFNVQDLAVDGDRLFASTFEAGVQVSVRGGPWMRLSGGFTETFVTDLAIQGPYLVAGVQGEGIWWLPLSEVPSALARPRIPSPGREIPGTFLSGNRVGFIRGDGARDPGKAFDAAGRTGTLLPKTP